MMLNRGVMPLFSRVPIKRFIICLLFFITLLLGFSIYNYRIYINNDGVTSENAYIYEIASHNSIVTDYYSKRKSWTTSNLGTILFKNENISAQKQNKTFTILIWKYWDWLKKRHVNGFGSSREDPLDGCSVRNCKFYGNDSLLATADAMVVHVHHGDKPEVKVRNSNQRWIFLSDESPRNTFGLTKDKPRLKDWANVFNWSMTYRSDSDIPVPYGRTVSLPKPIYENISPSVIAELVPNWKKKRRDVLATVLISNCGVADRMKFLDELKIHLDVDVHGKCSKNLKNTCPGHFKSDCEAMSQYLFYLVLENSMCRQYLTEKSFYNAYSKGAIPIIRGPPKEDCEKLLPPNSYLHIDDYKTPKDMAKDIIKISNDETRLLSFHYWRNDFEVLNEHGYFGSKSYHMCRLCEAMNYNDKGKSVYDEDMLKIFLDPNILCN